MKPLRPGGPRAGLSLVSWRRTSDRLISRPVQANVTTIIPVHNGEKFLRATLQSVADQTRRPDRLIVVDNCSTDGTEKIVREFTAMKCEWFRNPTNLGLFGNMNRALRR